MMMASTAITHCVTRSMRRRSMRSAATPPNGIRIRAGIDAAKLTDASANAEEARVVTTHP